MKKLMIIAAATLMGGTAPSFADSQIFGTWRTQTYDGDYAHVRMANCGGKICGVVAKTFGPNGEIQGGSLGKTIVTNMVPVGDGTYDNGRIRRPDTGQSAPLKLQVSGNTMNVRACVGPICRNETWRRVR